VVTSLASNPQSFPRIHLSGFVEFLLILRFRSALFAVGEPPEPEVPGAGFGKGNGNLGRNP
jgi:hypothetical protein